MGLGLLSEQNARHLQTTVQHGIDRLGQDKTAIYTVIIAIMKRRGLFKDSVLELTWAVTPTAWFVLAVEEQ